jgi:hypothetical protein
MASLMIGNVDGSASDDEIRDLLARYGFPPCDSIEHIPGDGSRPAVLLRYGGAPAEALRTLQPRLQDLFWKNRKIQVSVIDQRYDEGAERR